MSLTVIHGHSKSLMVQRYDRCPADHLWSPAGHLGSLAGHLGHRPVILGHWPVIMGHLG